MKEYRTDVFRQFGDSWGILCSGSMEDHNAMTIAWGGFGTLWNKPVVTVYVKPSRYTWQYMENNEYFTVSFYPEEYRDALIQMGTTSGRTTDKDAVSGLTPVPVGESVGYREARTTILCRKIYWDDLDTDRMPREVVKEVYSDIDRTQRMYIGEVIDIIDA